jgi:PAS domain S-box-containing protein
MAGPLLSWDIFMDSYQRTMRRLDDLQRLQKLSAQHQWNKEWDFEELLLRKGKVILVTDSSLSICYASSSLTDMNGYAPEEVMGKKPTLFQGKETQAQPRAQIRSDIKQLRPFSVTLLNYRKDGSLYNCAIEGYPVFTKKKKHSHFIAIEQLVPLQ